MREAIEAIFSSWNGARARAFREREGIDHELGTAANVQAMVFGNRDDSSGTGVAFTRNPSTGEPVAYGDFMVNAQGEDVVAGTSITRPLSDLDYLFPDVANQLREVFARLEAHFRDMCDIEFTVEQGRLWMLQTRPGMRTGAAALRMAVDMVNDSAIHLSRAEAISRITGDHLDQVLHPTFAQKLSVTPLATGLAASPGAAVGRAYFDAQTAIDAAARGERVVLVRAETSPDDVAGMLVSEGIVTARGGLVSHAAVVARGWGKPAVVGVSSLIVAAHEAYVADVVIARGGLDLARRGHRRRRARRSRVDLEHARPSNSTSSCVGPTRFVADTSACAPTPIPPPTRAPRASAVPRALVCAAPNTCSSARIDFPWCAR